MLLCCRCLLWCRCGLFMLRFLQWNVWFGNAFSTLVRLSVISCWFLEPCALCQQICRNVKTEELLRGGLSTEPRSLPIQRLIHNYSVEKNVVVSGRPNQMRPSSVVVVYVRSSGSKPCIGRTLAIWTRYKHATREPVIHSYQRPNNVVAAYFKKQWHYDPF